MPRVIVTDDSDFEATKAPSLKVRLLAAALKGAPAAGALVGGAVGAAAGAPVGGVGAIPGSIAGAGLGGMAGRAYQRVGEYLTGSRDPASDRSLEVASDISKSGLAGMAGQTLAAGIGRGLDALRPVGAGVATIATGIPEKYTKAVFKDPSILSRAAPTKAMGEAYQAFQRYTGLRGLEETIVAGGRATMGASKLERMVIGAANKVAAGKVVDPQELYLASQAASRLNLVAKYGEPQAQMAAASRAVKQGKQLVDDALEKVYPEYGGLRVGEFSAKAREAFGNILPRNKGGTPNVARPLSFLTTGAVGGAAAGGEGNRGRGALLGAAAAAASSPALWGLGIRGAAAVSPVAKFLAKYGTAAAAQKLADEEKK